MNAMPRDGFTCIGCGTQYHQCLSEMKESLFALFEDIRDPGVISLLYTEFGESFERIFNDIVSVVEQTGGAIPDLIPVAPLGYDAPSHIGIVARVERAVAERTVLALEVAGVIFALQIGMYVPS